MIYAVYRCLYGEDFVQESINSIIDHVDKVFVFFTNKPWGRSRFVEYNDEIVVFPKKFDNVVDKIKSLNNEKIHLIDQGIHYVNEPWNVYTVLINNVVIPKYGKPDIFVMPEVDHVFADGDFKLALDEFRNSNYRVAKTRQIELWRTPCYRIPERTGRIGVVFWNMSCLNTLPATRGNANPNTEPMIENSILSISVYNLGFMVSEKVMYWKHLTAMAFCTIIDDSRPNPSWLKEKWINWDFEKNNKDLEISVGWEHVIPKAIKYENCRLPLSILERF